MVEKKFVVDGMDLHYQGPFSVVEFYKVVEEWIQKQGKEKNIKKKLEQVTDKGKKIEWNIEIWEDLPKFYRSVVRLRALFNHVEEKKVARGKKKRNLNTGEVLIILDGILESDLESVWEKKPTYYFMRAVVDRYFKKIRGVDEENKVTQDTNKLYDVISGFFDQYKI